jgi:TolB-like protein/class 3 adenylate cyclase/thioredoxin-like negative regulator of GroEL
VVRRLAAVLAADVVGYSRLMGVDEAGTLAALKSHRRELIEPRLAAHRGRIVKLMGDGLLAEFPSAVEAVQCAVELQQAMAARTRGVPEPRRIRYRIGINIGDVVVDGADIYGDGVNIAARLEALSDPGGVCVARGVVEQVRGKLDLTFEHLGDRQVKNIADRIGLYRVVLDDKAAALAETASRVPARAARRRVAYATAVAALLLAVAATIGWGLWTFALTPTSLENAVPPPRDKPSIAVLPFANLSDDPDQEWFVDGMTEDLITDLSKVSGLVVIARNSTFTYKGRHAKAQDVARDLGVSHILEGSVRRAGDQVRINAQLIDAATAGHLWAERFDETMTSIFALQDRVTRRIVAGLAVTLTASEQQRLARRDTANVEAYEAFLRGWEHVRRFTPEDFAEARDLFEKAVELDPQYGRAYAALALVHYRAFELGWAKELGMGWNIARLRAGRYLERAWASPTPLAHRVASEIYVRALRSEDALEQAQRALALDPNDAENHVAMARALIFHGQPEEAVALMETAMRLEVHYPAEYLHLLGLAYFGTNRFEEAATTFQEALARNPANHRVRALLAASYAFLQRRDDARRAFAAYMEAESIAHMTHTGAFTQEDLWAVWPFTRRSDRDRLLKGLTEASGRDFVAPNELPGDWGKRLEPRPE